ncbi:hypothetical protein V865_005721 [Kwoniella europaea PYCC6329]|uniref:Uncharacterized protein n=1 Tax=Kwoniella europaea PYCC6329 TaxID=1423913 RepID=A0AAX4KPV0_9TREE
MSGPTDIPIPEEVYNLYLRTLKDGDSIHPLMARREVHFPTLIEDWTTFWDPFLKDKTLAQISSTDEFRALNNFMLTLLTAIENIDKYEPDPFTSDAPSVGSSQSGNDTQYQPPPPPPPPRDALVGWKAKGLGSKNVAQGHTKPEGTQIATIRKQQKALDLLAAKVNDQDDIIRQLQERVSQLEAGSKPISFTCQPVSAESSKIDNDPSSEVTIDQAKDAPKILPFYLNISTHSVSNPNEFSDQDVLPTETEPSPDSSRSDEDYDVVAVSPKSPSGNRLPIIEEPKAVEGIQPGEPDPVSPKITIGNDLVESKCSNHDKTEVPPEAASLDTSPLPSTKTEVSSVDGPLTEFQEDTTTQLLLLKTRIEQLEADQHTARLENQLLKTEIESVKNSQPLTRKDRKGLKHLQDEMNKLRTIQNNDIRNNIFFKGLLEKLNERVEGMEPGKMASLLNNLNYLKGRLEVLEDRLKLQERRSGIMQMIRSGLGRFRNS